MRVCAHVHNEVIKAEELLNGSFDYIMLGTAV